MVFIALDCFEIGRFAYNGEDYYHTLLWMEEALRRSKTENPTTINEDEILEYLGFALFKQGNLKKALQITDRLLEIGIIFIIILNFWSEKKC